MSHPIRALPDQVDLPPITPKHRAAAPEVFKYLDQLLQAIRKRESNTSTAVATITIKGLDAHKPAPSTPGRLFFATDSHTLYADDGESWTVI